MRGNYLGAYHEGTKEPVFAGPPHPGPLPEGEGDHRDRGTTAPHYHPLVIVLAAVAAGIVADRYRPLPLAAWWTMATMAGGAWVLLWRRGRRMLAAFTLLAAVAATAGAWHHCRWYLMAADDLGLAARTKAEPVAVKVVALQNPRRMPSPPIAPCGSRAARTKYACRCKRVPCVTGHTGGRPRAAALEVEGVPADVRAGDRLRIFAQIEAPSPRGTRASPIPPRTCAPRAFAVSCGRSLPSRFRGWRKASRGVPGGSWKACARAAIGC